MKRQTDRAVNLAELLSQTARRLPEDPALVCGEVRWNWQDVENGVGSLAAELRRRGVRAGDCVLVHSPNHVEFVQAMFAVWRIGAVLAPTNSRLSPAEVAVIAGVCRPVAVLCHRDLAEHAEAVRADHPLPAGTLWIGAGTDTADAVAALPPGSVDNTPVSVDDACWYFFTSGTSGAPKAAVLTHNQMGFVVTNQLADLLPGTTHQDVSLVVAPLSHGAGVHLLPQVARGAATVLTASGRLDGAEVWQLVERERVTNMFTVPTILKLLVEHPAVDRHDHSSLRHVIYAGAPMYRADQRRARQALGEVLVQYYGLAEVTGNITVLRPDEHDRTGPDGIEFTTCGSPRTGMQISVQDEHGSALGAGVQGEICVAGPAVFAGYLDNDAANDAAFRDGWFRTGDLGLFDEQGYLYITGRSSDMYISGGSNIHPRDIEEKLLHHPAIAEVAVLGMPHPLWGEVGTAVCVARPDSQVSADELRHWLGPRLSRYKIPRHFLLWDELPKSGYGKIVKRTIRARLEAQGWPPAEETS
ncbi:acyl-CoA synthetase [Streptomyces phaeochromogenes]|uniref:acyl-CoA synthetase n=1 Tax=Streptomyces phaeochromogenes TaxID=1923 RepID=UPI002DD9A2C0|nr:acyl-CoA synthetase [Streptomyces phaeochromogenes]WRZ34583.1 acyl-CoA synthetase [Streptomyces phaeochromogenes]